MFQSPVHRQGLRACPRRKARQPRCLVPRPCPRVSPGGSRLVHIHAACGTRYGAAVAFGTHAPRVTHVQNEYTQPFEHLAAQHASAQASAGAAYQDPSEQTESYNRLDRLGSTARGYQVLSDYLQPDLM